LWVILWIRGSLAVFGMRQKAMKVQGVTEFSIFCAFYMTSFLLDITEKWEYPGAALVFLMIILAIFIRGVSRWSLFIFLLLSTAHILLTDFTDVGNHNNIFLLCNFFFIAAIIYASLRPEVVAGDDDLFEILKPPLRVIVSLVYFFAGFHKLNADFLLPVTGCAAGFFDGILAVLRLPSIALPDFVVFGVSVSVLAWELGGGVLLWVRRLQGPVLLVCWGMHSLLAQIVFFDFSSLAFALMLTFIPRSYWDLIKEKSMVRMGPIPLHRVDMYFYANVIVAVAAGIYFWQHGYQRSFHRWQGLVLILGSVIFMWPVIQQLFKDRWRMKWYGVSMWNRNAPRWCAVLPAFVIFFGMNPYLGLRTAGTFTMFSNLRTEGDSSNHLLLGSNPLKLWNYQEDLVEIIDIDPRHPTSPQRSLAGYLLPAVEFKKQIDEWRRRGIRDLYAVVKYKDRVYETGDLVLDNPWDVRGRDLEMYLLDFRVVQKSPTPNHCRW
jgi:hypothetical protein